MGFFTTAGWPAVVQTNRLCRRIVGSISTSLTSIRRTSIQTHESGVQCSQFVCLWSSFFAPEILSTAIQACLTDHAGDAACEGPAKHVAMGQPAMQLSTGNMGLVETFLEQFIQHTLDAAIQCFPFGQRPGQKFETVGRV